MPANKKLIEVALPLEAINAESAREKSIRHGHPSTLHLWWARRPLTTARAVIWSSLVDDPSSHPEQFPTEEAQRAERERLFDILTRLVKWENSNDPGVLAEAKAEIRKSCGDDKITLLDPFAGGGAIPLEAQRLGLEAHAHDLNPVAVMINKAMIEIPPKFAGQSPVNPERQRQAAANIGWKGAAGLADDVRYYGEWMKQEAFKRIGHLYPKVKTPDGNEATVIAWIWARTVKCPNPACGCEMPLVRAFNISKKRGHEAVIVPKISGSEIRYAIKPGKDTVDGTVARKGARCIFCNSSVEFPYIREEGKNGRFGKQLIGIVAEGAHGRLFLPPDDEQTRAANVEKPDNCPSSHIPDQALGFRVQLYGMNHYEDVYTNRQLTALTTLSDLLPEVQKKVLNDAKAAGMADDFQSLEKGGTLATAYSEAIVVYLAMLIDQLANQSSMLCSWHVNNIQMKSTFSRQSLPMVWDYAESNVFCSSSGSMNNMLQMMTEGITSLNSDNQGIVAQANAMNPYSLHDIMISTDPPYYDNIGYADLSDYFYMWLRQNIKSIYPSVVSTMQTPKDDELIATPFRNNGSMDQARNFFENGMKCAFTEMYNVVNEELPLTVYYAFKQSETTEDDDEGTTTTSTGWETMLSALISSGFTIAGTWPMRTEMTTGVKTAINVLASSIVLVCRKRPDTARSITRREFINTLHREMRPALEKLQSANIAPVDLAQSAIGPGIGVFSRYKSVLEADGKPMSVRAALQIINQELDSFYNEQEGELDRDSRFCVDLFNQYAFNTIKFGDADILARAKNTSVQALADRGVLDASKGMVRLLTREEISEKVRTTEDCTWLLTQQLARAMEKGGVKACAEIIYNMFGSNAENAKALAYRLYTICERKNWAQEGYAYNNLVVAWPDIQSMAAEMQAAQPVQLTFDSLIPNA